MPTLQAFIYDSRGVATGLHAVSMAYHQTEDHHDLLELEVRDNYANLQRQAPVLVQWSTRSLVRTFYGYNDTPVSSGGRNGAQAFTKLSLLGASSAPLKDQSQRVWTQSSPFVIANDVVAPKQLGLYVDNYPYPIPTMSQSGMTDWQLLRALAEKIGYSLYTQGIVVYLVDPVRERRRSLRSIVPILTLSTPTITGNVEHFEVESTNDPSGTDFADTVMNGVDRFGGAFTYSTGWAFHRGSKASRSVISSHHYDSLGKAMIEAERINRQARWTTRGEFVCSGDPSIRAGRCVFVNDAAREHTGMWYVTDVRHELTVKSGQYKCYVTACRDEAEGVIVPESRIEDVRLDALLDSSGRWRANRRWTVAA